MSQSGIVPQSLIPLLVLEGFSVEPSLVCSAEGTLLRPSVSESPGTESGPDECPVCSPLYNKSEELGGGVGRGKVVVVVLAQVHGSSPRDGRGVRRLVVREVVHHVADLALRVHAGRR